MSEFHDPFPNYEMMAHHDEPAGKKIRKTLWMVFWVLLAITLIEIYIGIKAEDWGWGKLALKWIFITLTIVKAGAIVYVFMHLKDEVRAKRMMILWPFSGFIIYLIAMMTICEGKYSKEARLDQPIPDEKVHAMEEARLHHASGGGENNTAPASDNHGGGH
jgi:cytochrome c oxidase subunit IV